MTRTQRVPDQAFPCLCLSRQVQIWFRNRSRRQTHNQQM
jgi:hypothetical protein